jgi:hypothetical protein
VSPIRVASSVFLSFFLSLSLAAQQPTVTQQGPLLLQRALTAMTGGGALRDVVINGTATLKALPAGESRIDLSFPSGTRTEVRANSDAGFGISMLKADASGRPRIVEVRLNKQTYQQERQEAYDIDLACLSTVYGCASPVAFIQRVKQTTVIVEDR